MGNDQHCDYCDRPLDVVRYSIKQDIMTDMFLGHIAWRCKVHSNQLHVSLKAKTFEEARTELGKFLEEK